MTSSLQWSDITWLSESASNALAFCTLPYRELVLGAYVDMAKRFCDRPSSLGEQFDRVHQLGTNIYELDLTGGDRAVVEATDGRLVMLTFGNHDLIAKRRLKVSAVNRLREESVVALDRCIKELVFSCSNKRAFESLIDAYDDRWAYTLDIEQQAIAEKILDSQLKAAQNGGTHVAVVTGGPGTGKTALLAQMGLLFGWDPEHVGLVAPPQVVDFLTASGGTGPDGCAMALSTPTKRSAWLIDDPPRWSVVEQAISYARYLHVPLVLIATDLAQVRDVLSDRDLKVFFGGEINHYNLTRCYRQTEKVGAVSMRFLRSISERFKKHINADADRRWRREHQLSVETANELRFVQPGGFGEVRECRDTEEILEELLECLGGSIWTRWSPLGFVVDDQLTGLEQLESAASACGARWYLLSEAEELRGIEFQHLFVLVSRRLLNQLLVTGRSGLSTADYIVARNMRIPFSRATDSIRVFSISEGSGN